MSAGGPTSSSNGASAEGPQPAGLRLGGMALRNGLLIHGPTSWAIAARATSGGVEVASGRKPDFGGERVAKTPLLRGPVRLAEAFAVIPIARRALPSARLPFEDPKVLAAGLASAAAGGVLRGSAESPGPIREAAAAIVGLLPAMVALGGGSELAAYHGVEHKAIGAYERGERDPTVAPKEHQRCGSNLVVPMLLSSLAGGLVIERLLESPGRLARGAVAVASVSVAVEAFVWAERRPDSPLGRAVHAAGDAIQRLVATREPTGEQLEVGVAALDAILAAERGESG